MNQTFTMVYINFGPNSRRLQEWKDTVVSSHYQHFVSLVLSEESLSTKLVQVVLIHRLLVIVTK